MLPADLSEEWSKMKGDHVELGETIAEALTDKVNAAGWGGRTGDFKPWMLFEPAESKRTTPCHPRRPCHRLRSFALTRGQHWSELLKQAKDVGEVNIQACALDGHVRYRA